MDREGNGKEAKSRVIVSDINPAMLKVGEERESGGERIEESRFRYEDGCGVGICGSERGEVTV